MNDKGISSPVKVVIAEDQVMMAEGLATVLEKDGEFKVLALAQNGEQLLHLLNSHQPDLILLDLNMPVLNGLQACRQIRTKFPGIVVVVLTMYNNNKVLQDVKEAGAAGMILKYTSAKELPQKLFSILKNNEFTADKMAIESLNPDMNLSDNFLLKYQISKRELEIINLVVKGFQTDQIAAKLFLSAHTVNTHRKNILHKLNVKNSVELINFIAKSGIL